MTSDSLVHALVVHTSADEVEALIKVIRNSGYALRTAHVEDVEDMLAALGERDFDFVFSAMEVFEGTIEEVAEALKECPSECTLLAVLDGLEPEQVVAAMLAGASDAVSYAYPQHLSLVLERELTSRAAMAEARRWREAYDSNEKRLRVLLDTSRDAITYVHEGMHIYANPAYLKLFGVKSFDDILALPIMDMVQPEAHQALKQQLRASRDQFSQLDVVAVAGGRPLPVTMEFAPARYDDEPCTQITIHDHSLQRELAAKVRDLKKYDQLTELFNRTAFLAQLKRRFRAPRGQALLFADLDAVRAIRDTLGLEGRDLLIKTLATDVSETLGKAAILGRFADFTFAAIVTAGTSKDLEAICETLRTHVADQIFDVEGKSISVTLSIGACLLSTSQDGLQQAVDAAERGVSEARAEGGNALRLINPLREASEGTGEVRKWVLAIRDALKTNRFRLWYQPIANLQGDSEEQYDVHSRMLNEKGDVIDSQLYLPVARDKGLMPAIDRWLIANALNVVAHRRKARHKTRVFITLSEESLVDTNLMGWVRERVMAFKVAPDSVVLVVRAAEAIVHLREVSELLKQASHLGLLSALDEFKGAAAELPLLDRFRVDYLRISPSIIGVLGEQDEAQDVLAAIAERLEGSAVQPIANGVDDPAALASLWQYKIGLIQGDFLAEASDKMDFDFVGEVM